MKQKTCTVSKFDIEKKTAHVKHEYKIIHKKYKKVIKKESKIVCHLDSSCVNIEKIHVGCKVILIDTKKYSKTKSSKITEVICNITN